MMKSKRREIVISFAQIIAGCLIAGCAYPLFLVPHSIAPGGVTGLATIFNYLFQLPVGLLSLAFNIPLFIMGYRTCGRNFFFKSLFATVIFSLAIDIIKLPAMDVDPLMASIFGGVLMGVGIGLILRGGATTGGSDMFAKIVHQHFQNTSIGTILFAFDGCVVACVGIFVGISQALYAVICVFIQSKIVDLVIAGVSTNKACFIITDSWQEVSEQILRTMDRGLTQLTARGGYTGKERPVVLCVVNTQEIPRLKEIVKRIDKDAFVFVTDVQETLGEGFTSPQHDKISG